MFRRFHNATTIIPVDTLPASGIAGVLYLWGNYVYINKYGSWLNTKEQDTSMPNILNRALKVATLGDSTALSSVFANTNTNPMTTAFPVSGTAQINVSQQSASVMKFMPSVLCANGGIAGQKLSDIIDRSNDAYSATRKSISDVLATNPDLVLLHASINDFGTYVNKSSDQSVVDTIRQKYIWICDYLESVAQPTIATGALGINGDGIPDPDDLQAKRSAIVSSNNFWQTHFQQYKYVKFLNPNGSINIDGAIKAEYTDDGTHMNAKGGRVLGLLEAGIASVWYQSKQIGSSLIYDGGLYFAGRGENSNPLGNWYLDISGATIISKRTDIDGVTLSVNVTNSVNAINLYNGSDGSNVSPVFSGVSANDNVISCFDIVATQNGVNVGFDFLSEIFVYDSTNTKSIRSVMDIGYAVGDVKPCHQFVFPVSFADLGNNSYITYGAQNLPLGVVDIKLSPLMIWKQ